MGAGGQGGAPDPEFDFPAGNWTTASTASELGVSDSAWNTFKSFVGGHITASRNGVLLPGGGSGPSHKCNWASASKPFISVMYWKAVADALVTSLTALIKDYDTGNSYNTKDDGINVYHLGHMQSGWGLDEDPGEALAYNDPAINKYGRVLIDEIYEDTATNVFRNELPLGYQNSPVLDSDTQFCRMTDVSLGDMNRFGLFCMARGKWQTTQIIPASYFESMENNTVPTDFPVSTGDEITPSFDEGTFGGGFFNETSSEEAIGTYSWNFWNNLNGLLFPDCPTDTIAMIGHVGLEVCIYIRSLGIVITWATDSNLTNSQINTALAALIAGIT